MINPIFVVVGVASIFAVSLPMLIIRMIVADRIENPRILWTYPMSMFCIRWWNPLTGYLSRIKPLTQGNEALVNNYRNIDIHGEYTRS